MLDKFQQSTAGASPTWSLGKFQELNAGIGAAEGAELQKCWERYEKTYKGYLKKHFVKADLEGLAAEVLANVQDANMPETVGGICAVWSLCDLSADETGSDEDSQLRQPHVVQILGIFTLLGLTTPAAFGSGVKSGFK
eukprot:COSAG06_NODE_39311_length_414_cov_0.707937_1_plen_137_part_11